MAKNKALFLPKFVFLGFGEGSNRRLYVKEWWFNVVKNGKEIFRKTTLQLEEFGKDYSYRDVRDYLMAEIALWLVFQNDH